MSWRVVVRPEVAEDIAQTADWYDSREKGLGDKFIDEVIVEFSALDENPLLRSRRHPQKNIRSRYPEHFPYKGHLRSDRKPEARYHSGCA